MKRRRKIRNRRRRRVAEGVRKDRGRRRKAATLNVRGHFDNGTAEAEIMCTPVVLK